MHEICVILIHDPGIRPGPGIKLETFGLADECSITASSLHCSRPNSDSWVISHRNVIFQHFDPRVIKFLKILTCMITASLQNLMLHYLHSSVINSYLKVKLDTYLHMLHLERCCMPSRTFTCFFIKWKIINLKPFLLFQVILKQLQHWKTNHD